MNDIRSAFKLLFNDKTTSEHLSSLDKYVEDIASENLEHLSFEESDDVPKSSFDQISSNRISSEINKDFTLMKSIESIIRDRANAYTSFSNNSSKYKAPTESVLFPDATLNIGIEKMLEYFDQETIIAKQLSIFDETKQEMKLLRHEAREKFAEYQRDVLAAEKEVMAAEKKLIKTRETFEKTWEVKLKADSDDMDAKFALAANTRNSSVSTTSGKSSQRADDQEQILKCEKELQNDIKILLRAVNSRDQIQAASRRAHQNLDKECKKMMVLMLSKILAKEKVWEARRRASLEQFENAVLALNIDRDVDDFIERNIAHDTDESLVLMSQALTLLNDVPPNSTGKSRSNSIIPSSQRASLHANPTSSSSATNSNSSTFSFSNLPLSQSKSKQTPENNINSNTNTSSNTNNSSNTSGLMSRWEAMMSPYFTPQSSLKLSQPQSRPETPIHSRHQMDETTSDGNTTDDPSSPTLVEKRSVSSSLVLTEKLQDEFQTLSSRVSEDAFLIKSKSGVKVNSTFNSGKEIEKCLFQIFEISSRNSKDGKDKDFDNELDMEGSTNALMAVLETNSGRQEFVQVLNQFRSRKVELDAGFEYLGRVLIRCLDLCALHNDIHSSKIIMMLSQTFYKEQTLECEPEENNLENDGNSSKDNESFEVVPRAVLARSISSCIYNNRSGRVYLKELLSSHQIWKNKNFWEQTLWDCVLEQVKTIPYEKLWYLLDRDERTELARRVHSVVFSQSMAITHSMVELGCCLADAKDFMYRICTVHQLGEKHRQLLLTHLLLR